MLARKKRKKPLAATARAGVSCYVLQVEAGAATAAYFCTEMKQELPPVQQSPCSAYGPQGAPQFRFCPEHKVNLTPLL